MFKNSKRYALLASVITALVVVLAMAGISTAASSSNQADAAKKKAAFTKAQTRALNKAIAKALKKKVGPAGPAGAAGPAVAPAAFFATSADSGLLPNDVSVFTPVLSKSLPAGKYVVNARVHAFMVADNATDKFAMQCRALNGAALLDSSTTADSADQFLLIAAGAHGNMALNFTVDLPATTTITIACNNGRDTVGAGQGTSVPENGARLNAIAVSSIG